MTSYLQETKFAKVERNLDALTATTTEIARLNALQVVGINQATWTSQENQLVVLRERQIVLTRELAAARAILAPAAWWDFSLVGTLWQDTARTLPVTADNQQIFGVTDLSGNGKHLLQASAGNAPRYKVAIMNGRSVVRFDGTDDYLTLSSVFAQPTTFFIVANHTSAASGVDDTLTDSGAAGNTMRMYWDHTPGALTLYAGTVLTDGVLTTNTPFIATGVFSGAVSRIARSGTSTVGNGGTATPATTFYLGCFGTAVSAFWSGDMAEVLVYNTALGVSDINAIGQSLAYKWGITWTTIP